jgi:hypothetical protein
MTAGRLRSPCQSVLWREVAPRLQCCRPCICRAEPAACRGRCRASCAPAAPAAPPCTYRPARAAPMPPCPRRGCSWPTLDALCTHPLPRTRRTRPRARAALRRGFARCARCHARCPLLEPATVLVVLELLHPGRRPARAAGSCGGAGRRRGRGGELYFIYSYRDAAAAAAPRPGRRGAFPIPFARKNQVIKSKSRIRKK